MGIASASGCVTVGAGAEAAEARSSAPPDDAATACADPAAALVAAPSNTLADVAESGPPSAGGTTETALATMVLTAWAAVPAAASVGLATGPLEPLTRSPLPLTCPSSEPPSAGGGVAASTLATTPPAAWAAAPPAPLTRSGLPVTGANSEPLWLPGGGGVAPRSVATPLTARVAVPAAASVALVTGLVAPLTRSGLPVTGANSEPLSLPGGGVGAPRSVATPLTARTAVPAAASVALVTGLVAPLTRSRLPVTGANSEPLSLPGGGGVAPRSVATPLTACVAVPAAASVALVTGPVGPFTGSGLPVAGAKS